MRPALLLGAALITMPGIARAQADPPAGDHDTMPGMAMPSPSAPPAGGAEHQADDTSAMPAASGAPMQHDMAGMPGMAGMQHAMPAMLDPYAMNREASGTSWQPESSPMYASMFNAGDWMGMAQG